MMQMLAEGLLVLVAIAVVARVVYGLLGPLLVPLLLILLVGAIAVRLLRRQ
jgi:predicted Na+-dependent transporter